MPRFDPFEQGFAHHEEVRHAQSAVYTSIGRPVGLYIGRRIPRKRCEVFTEYIPDGLHALVL